MVGLSKIFRVIIPLWCISFALISCTEEQDDDEPIYIFGLTSSINSKNSEIEAINFAYYDAYRMNGLTCGSQSFARGTSKDLILKSCKLAEDAILTSSIKFDGRYIYEVKSKDVVLYHKMYGTR